MTNAYIEKDGKEHINHGMIEYTKSDLELHNDAFEHSHDGEEVDPNEGKINDWHNRHHPGTAFEEFCDVHPDAMDAGFKIWCDPRIRVGHEKTRVI